MKKLLTLLCLTATLAANAATHQWLSFLDYDSRLALGNRDFVSVVSTNGQITKLFNVPGFLTPQTAITYYLYGNNYPQIVSVSSAIVAYATNMIGGNSNTFIGATAGFTNVTGVGANLFSYNPFGYQLTGTNTYLIQYTSGTSNANGGNIIGSPFMPITLPVGDANGCINSNTVFVFAFAGDSTTCTNTTNQVLFAKSYDGNVYDMVNTNSVSITLNGTNDVLGTYQPSAAWLAGVQSVAIYSIFTGTNTSSTNTYLTKAGISTYIP